MARKPRQPQHTDVEPKPRQPHIRMLRAGVFSVAPHLPMFAAELHDEISIGPYTVIGETAQSIPLDLVSQLVLLGACEIK